MTERLILLWRWVGAHRLLTGWAVAAVCVAVFSGGAALGAASEQPMLFDEAAELRPAKVRSPVVVVMRRRGGTLIGRTVAGDQLIVRTNARTTFRQSGQEVEPGAVRRGSRVIVIGRRVDEGVIVARVVAIRGQVRVGGPNPPAPFPAREGGDQSDGG